MKPLLRIDLDKALNNPPVILELGCGRNKRPGAIGIDKLDLPGVDIVTDIEDGLGFIPDNCVDEIYSFSCFEHIRNFEKLMSEIVRVLKNGGKTIVYVPHFSSPYYYSDPTHTRFFGLYSFYYFVNHRYQLKRKVPDYYFDTKIRIVSLKLVFDSTFLFRKIIKRSIGAIINLSRYLQEFYEENLCYIFPCNGIEVVFTKDK
ncbi:MAG: methyltransferase domain-containing protein [Planctomycetota bacterium]|nr:methyltransferase domain-containing protein [Planctomycetota bacterium]